MAPHVSHVGVHDHGFNNLSTYGNLRRLMLEGRLPMDRSELSLYELAVKLSGAVQAARWTETAAGRGFIHSFNGPHSLFSDTMRSLRILCLADRLGHVLMGEGDRRIGLLGRAVDHALTTCEFNVYYGEGRDAFDVDGRVVHESIFNTRDGNYRCPSTQQGYSPFSTWTRGLAWILCGCAELLEYFETLPAETLEPFGGQEVTAAIERAALATAEFHVRNSFADGVPFWDTGAPGAAAFGGHRRTALGPPQRRRAPRQLRGGDLRARLPAPGELLPVPGRPGARRPLPRRRLHHRRRPAVGTVPVRGPVPPGAAAALDSTTGPTAGTAFLRGGSSPAASPRCGGTTTYSSWRC